MRKSRIVSFGLIAAALATVAFAQEPTGKAWLAAHYSKREVMIPMRDGVKLFTSIYEPKDAAAAVEKPVDALPADAANLPVSKRVRAVAIFCDISSPQKSFVQVRYLPGSGVALRSAALHIGDPLAPELQDVVVEAIEPGVVRFKFKDGRPSETLESQEYSIKSEAAGARSPSPILLRRTPYSCSPYGETEFPEILGPNTHFHEKGYAYVVQDVRGAYMSEGEFVDVRPHVAAKRGPKEIDESTDAYDTIAWLVANVPNNNGRVGMWGISYPGFYASAGMIDAHPALKAVSPQAPIADWWYDDFHHHGALFLPHAFNFLYGFGRPRPEPTKQRSGRIDHGTPDGYRFFLELGSLANVNAKWFKGEVAFWNDVVAHPNYDEFWQARNLLPHLKNVAPAVMTVGGWYDAEDLYGALNTYRAIEQQNPGIYNVLVMGPWVHGGWARTDGDKLGHARFGSKTSLAYRTDMELAFFEHFLRDVDVPKPAEANVFDTGANEWRAFDAWPPKDVVRASYGMDAEGALVAAEGPRNVGAVCREFVSDPNRPVPFTTAISTSMTREYMTDDQRFAARRPDVLVYETRKLEADLTLAGPLVANLVVTTTGTDGDWIVKLIDVFPDDAPDPKGDDALAPGQRMAGYQMLVRSEVVRGRFRGDPSKPEPFEPGRLTEVDVPLLDVLHTFKKGHKLMVQVQCTWFPLVDRNPQTFVPNIYEARETDFVSARVAVWNASNLTVNVLRGAKK